MSQPGLFDFRPLKNRPVELGPDLSRTQRLTAQNRALLDRGVHPVTRVDLRTEGRTCGDCAHHHAVESAKVYHKCATHRLGMSSSDASDIRVSWPACVLFMAASE